MLFKSFPSFSEELLNMINNIKINVSNLISDYNLNKAVKKLFDRTKYFIERVILQSEYNNPNTFFI